MARKPKETITQRWLRTLTGADMVVLLLPALMLLLVAGTVAQRYMGLYQSERLFFSSFILWIGFIPLPGAYTLLGILTLSLAAKIILKSPWKREQAGVIITHMGALLLLLGGLLTALTEEEGYIALDKGGASSVVSDYHDRELAVLRNSEAVARFPLGQLHPGETLAPEGLPFRIRTADACRNCLPARWRETPVTPHGLATQFTLGPVPSESEDEENRAGAILILSGAGEASGTWVAYERAKDQPEFSIGKDTYRIEMRKAERSLPFAVRLDEFTKTLHSGTDTPSAYQSAVTVFDGALAWPAIIRMNHPLRLHGYTLYQSAFVTTEAGEQSVLAVVKNKGRVFPYVASLVMCAGIITHLLLRRDPKRRKRP